jgi:phosphate transport system substrate-binding protein
MNIINQKVIMRKKILVLLVTFLLFGVLLFPQITDENEPAKVVQDVNLNQYVPFRAGNKLVSLDRNSTFRLSEDLPRLDGATALYPVYASFVQAVYPDNIIGPNGVSIYYEFYRGNVKCTQTPRAYENLINGEVDIIFCAEPSRDQIAQAAEKGLEFNMIPIGKDAFVFFINKNNPINNITSSQIRAIYSGAITNWREIGGHDSEIIPYQRPQNSGSQTILESVIMRGTAPMEPLKEEHIVGGMGGIVEQVSDYRNYLNAIGYSFLFFTTEMVKNDEIKLLSIDGIMPSIETIQSDEYGFTGYFYAITTGNETENTKRFIEWILSEEGQYLIEKTGYIPIR